MSHSRISIRRVDRNQAAIVKALRIFGASVTDLHALGHGVPDLLVGFHGVNYLMEVKNPTGRGNRFTPAERVFMASWQGQVAVIEDIASALALLADTGRP